MENTIIFVVIIVLIIVGVILYAYRDTIKHAYNKKSGKVKETLSNAAKQVKEDIKN